MEVFWDHEKKGEFITIDEVSKITGIEKEEVIERLNLMERGYFGRWISDEYFITRRLFWQKQEDLADAIRMEYEKISQVHYHT